MSRNEIREEYEASIAKIDFKFRNEDRFLILRPKSEILAELCFCFHYIFAQNSSKIGLYTQNFSRISRFTRKFRENFSSTFLFATSAAHFKLRKRIRAANLLFNKNKKESGQDNPKT